MIAAMTLLVATAFTAVLQRPMPVAADTSCRKLLFQGDPVPDSLRKRSPLDSVTFHVGGDPVKICYSRPSARGRTMLGGRLIPYSRLWQTGDNEPTYLFITAPIALAGLAVPPGEYSLYTRPGETEWEIMVNRSLSAWGTDLDIDRQAQDLGRTVVQREWTPQYVETFTIRPEPSTGDAQAIVLEWERSRIRIPVYAGTPNSMDDVLHCIRTEYSWRTQYAGSCFPVPGRES